jgi:asparagine N-glycosylation enzyme membrane subunit Stt3
MRCARCSSTALRASRAYAPHAIAIVAATATLLVGTIAGAWIAGGSDSYCYVEQAERWASGDILTPQALDFIPPWADRWLPLAPTGFVPSRTVAGAIAPICPSGLALTMTPFRWIGGRTAVFLVVPLLGAVLVWATFLLGARLKGSWTGALAAVLTAASPIVLFQVVQPMSDAPAAAWTTLATWLVLRGGSRGLVFAGLSTAAAVLTRPVLAPVAVVLFVAVLLRPGGASVRARARDAMCFGVGGLPGALALALIQQALYGSPFSSGYGSTDALFALARVAPNARRYAQWALETQTPLVLLAPAALLVRRVRWEGSVLLAASAAVVAAYLPYVTFDDWSYLRFLLPAIPLVLVLVSSVVVSLAMRLPWRWPAIAVAAVGLLVSWQYVHTARTRYAFDLRTSEAKFRIAGEYIRRTLPPRAVVLTVWHSGSVRYYGERLSIAWDGFPPQDLEPTLGALERAGRTPYLLFETFEEARFRERFAGVTALAALDWPPTAVIGRDVRLFNPADRDVYAAGGRVTTTRVPAR